MATAHKALVEAVDAANSPAGGSKAEGKATAELRALLRCEGLGGAAYYGGPAWLPPFFALLGVLAAPTEESPASDGAPPLPAAEHARALFVSVVSARGDAVGDALPDALMLTLLQFFAGLTKHAAAHEPMLLTKTISADDGREKPTCARRGPGAFFHSCARLL